MVWALAPMADKSKHTNANAVLIIDISNRVDLSFRPDSRPRAWRKGNVPRLDRRGQVGRLGEAQLVRCRVQEDAFLSLERDPAAGIDGYERKQRVAIFRQATVLLPNPEVRRTV